MLVSLTVENWMSFRDKNSLLMTATKERQHGERVPRVKRYQSRILPIAAIYGGNASGKTNLFQALSFVKDLVVRGTQPGNSILVKPFCLSAKKQKQACSFALEILVDEYIYEFSFSVNRKQIIEEKLVKITGSSEQELYSRKDGKITLDTALLTNPALEFVAEGTQDNQLFLTNSISQKIDTFRPVYDWFKDNLVLIAPDTRFAEFEQFINEKSPLYPKMNNLLQALDTGITQLASEEVPFSQTPIPEELRNKLQQEIMENHTVRLHAVPENQRYIITREDDKLLAKKLVSYHSGMDGKEIKFEINQESDGTQRIIDLLPAFLQMSESSSNRVFVIDEIDRSLHSILTQQLVTDYLASCSQDSRTQLLLTTHDLMLMNQQLLRRDEMWVVERDNEGASELIAFSEYKDVRYDKDIRKSYLQGRLGGIPRILSCVGMRDETATSVVAEGGI